MTTTPEHDPELVERVAAAISGAQLAFLFDRLSPVYAVLDAISEHESATGRAWFWVPAPDVIPAGQPHRVEYENGDAFDTSRPGAIHERPSQRVSNASYFVDCRWTPEPERVSVDKAALDALLSTYGATPAKGSKAGDLLDSVQPLDGGA